DMESIFHYFGAKLDKKERGNFYKLYKKSCALNQDTMEFFGRADTDISGIKETSKTKISTIAKKLRDFGEEIKNCDNETAIRIVCSKTGLQDIIENNDKTKQAFEKIISIARIYNDLKGFLDAIALNQDADAIGFNMEKVSLMTMHAAKGLEFPVVFVAGCEQGLVPFAKDGENIDDLEEERRLFYVAMTRAMDILCLTYAKKRTIYGKSFKRQRSFFIEDIEKRLTQVEKSPVFLSINKKEKQLELF
ncbi:MAG: ATP-dependent helicase, partial [Proteobacteria bacterium]|nr:ATP-dependent helicase [Pseudomonadota bacterium]